MSSACFLRFFQVFSAFCLLYILGVSGDSNNNTIHLLLGLNEPMIKYNQVAQSFLGL